MWYVSIQNKTKVDNSHTAHFFAKERATSIFANCGGIQYMPCLISGILLVQNTSRLNGASVWIERGCCNSG